MVGAIPCVKLVFPGFFDQVANHELKSFANDFPAIARIIDRGEMHDDSQFSIERDLLGAFDLTTHAEHLTVTALTAAADGIEYSPGMMRADPVHVRADGAQLRLFCGEGFEPSTAQSKLLIAELARLVPEAKFISGRHPARWYIQLAQAFDFSTPAPAEINQRAIEGHLPSGKDAPQLHVLLNEIQMALYQSEVNNQRERDGQSPINSIWFWGTRPLVTEGARANFALWGNDVVGCALAERSGATFFEELNVSEVVGATLPSHLSRLVLFNSPNGPLTERGPEINLEKFEQVWAPSLLRKLRLGGIQQLEIIDLRRRLIINRFDIWKIWRHSSYFKDKLTVHIDPSKISQDVSANDAFD